MANDAKAAGHPSTEEPALYPIRTVAEITGVNPVTLRAWERRYGLVKPQRTPKGHRLYSQQDIETIRRILELLDQGIPVGRVRDALARTPAADATRGEDPWAIYRSRMADAVARFDDRRLDAVYNDALSLYPVDLVTRHLIEPLVGELRGRQGEPLAEAEHRFFVSFLRNKLGARFHHMSAQTHGPRLLFACLPGEFSDVGLLLFALTAITHSYRPLLLGPDVPVEAVAAAVAGSGVAGVVTFADVPLPRAVLGSYLPALVRDVEVPVFVGGNIAQREHGAVEEAGAIALAHEATAALHDIDRAVGRRRK